MHNHFIIQQQPSRKIVLEGKEYDFFSGTSYLGMNQDSDFKALLIQGLHRYGMSFGSSRNGNLQLDIYEAAEQKLASWIGAEKALTVSSGMLAGQLVAQYLKTLNATFFYAPQSHSANFHEPTVKPPAISFQEWAAGVNQMLIDAQAAHSVIVCNSNDALRATQYDFGWTATLPENQQITLIIDDSHGLGITGNNGAGVFSNIRVKPNVEVLLVASLHKAMGIPGGVVLGSASTLENLRSTAFFSSCSPIAPAYLYAYTHADSIYRRNYERLQENIRRFESQLLSAESLFRYLTGFPVFYTPHDSLYEYLFQQKVFIYSFAYPVRTGKPNTRIVLSAWHEPDQIDLLAEKCNAFLKTVL